MGWGRAQIKAVHSYAQGPEAHGREAPEVALTGSSWFWATPAVNEESRFAFVLFWIRGFTLRACDTMTGPGLESLLRNLSDFVSSTLMPVRSRAVRMWAVPEALAFLPELVGGTPTPMPSIATRRGESGTGQGPAGAPSPPWAVDATPLPAILPVAEPLPLSSWPVTGGPCFLGTSGCGATSEEAGKHQCSRWLSFPPVLHNLKPHPHPGLTIHPSHLPGRAGPLPPSPPPCVFVSAACPTNFLPSALPSPRARPCCWVPQAMGRRVRLTRLSCLWVCGSLS